MIRVAKFLAQPLVAGALIRLAKRTPYRHLPGYMGRWWLFNPYEEKDGSRPPRGWIRRRIPSIRIHHIQRHDYGLALHDHPWNARTFVLRGWYVEEREDGIEHARVAGYTGTLRVGEFHRISAVSTGGVWTLFVTFEHRDDWGFKVAGRKVPHQEHLGVSSRNK